MLAAVDQDARRRVGQNPAISRGVRRVAQGDRDHARLGNREEDVQELDPVFRQDRHAVVHIKAEDLAEDARPADPPGHRGRNTRNARRRDVDERRPPGGETGALAEDVAEVTASVPFQYPFKYRSRGRRPPAAPSLWTNAAASEASQK